MRVVDESGDGHLSVAVQASPEPPAEHLEFGFVSQVDQDNGFLVVTHVTEPGKRVMTGLPLAKVKRWDLT